MAQSAGSMPAAIWDCHVHVVGDVNRYPMIVGRPYTPAPAQHEALLAHMDRLGLGHVVIVQPSFYGTDNRCMLDSLDRLQGRGRGIAVVDRTVTDAELRGLHRRGVRGLRVNVESTGVRDPDAIASTLSEWAGRIEPLGWHLQIYAAMEAIARVAGQLDRLPVPVVLDHFAMIPAHTSMESSLARTVIDLVAGGNAYVKLSASYRLRPDDSIETDVARMQVSAWARRFLEAAPERVLWGTDWPHTFREPGRAAMQVSRYRSIQDGALAREIFSWFSSTEDRDAALIRNPARLYA